MALAREFECKGWTADQYDALIVRCAERLNLAPDQIWPGNVFHWAAVTPTGLHVVDVYESREAGDRLAQEQIGPVAQELGLPMPEITEYEVHSFLTR